MAGFSWDEEVWRVDADDVGDLDPLAPGGEILTDDGHPDEDLPDVELGDGGSSDSRGIVRVWVEDGRLSRIRVSPLWHSKLGRGSLSDCFAQALSFANTSVAEVPVREQRSYDEVDFTHLPAFDPRALAAFQTVFDEVEQRWDEALDRRSDDAAAPAPATMGTYRGVAVSLNPGGLADRVTFDKAWLDKAQAGDISTYVIRAAERAYEQFIPADDHAELDDIAAEHEFLLAAFKAMLNPKEPT